MTAHIHNNFSINVCKTLQVKSSAHIAFSSGAKQSSNLFFLFFFAGSLTMTATKMKKGGEENCAFQRKWTEIFFFICNKDNNACSSVCINISGSKKTLKSHHE
jgi:hypothetical protein